MSPINIDSDLDTEEITPTTNNSDGVISRKDCDMFDMSNSDSDLDQEGEAETKFLVGELINRGKLPTKLHGIFYFLSQQTFTILLGMNTHLSPVEIIVLHQKDQTSQLQNST